MPDHARRRWFFFIDPIEASSYPVTETGYAMLYRAWCRRDDEDDAIYVVYPHTAFSLSAASSGSGEGQPTSATQITVQGHRLRGFTASPYDHYRSQRNHYDPAADLGSARCHEEGAAEAVELHPADVVVFRQESGPAEPRKQLLEALAAIEHEVLVYLSPKLALDPAFGSKALPARIAPETTPQSFNTRKTAGSAHEKAAAALAYVRGPLGHLDTVIAKPAHADNGAGIRILGRSPLLDVSPAEDAQRQLHDLVQRYRDVIVQEYIPSVRAPSDLDVPLAEVDPHRHDFGEVRFLLIDGEIPRRPDGQPIRMARRVPTDTSLLADSGISHPTTLSDAELRFLKKVGRAYVKMGIHFGGGDLIRTPNPARPFVFTDAARSVCGHAVVTGALNGAPYLVVDQVLASIERQWSLRHAPVS